jgi:DNA polymerase-3 subunit epsilon
VNSLPLSANRDHPARDFRTRMGNTEFSVVDVETTGLFPEHNDRIIEVAVVRVDFTGNVVDQYSTLVNPNRDLGPTHIHGISARNVSDAPPFGEIAGDVLSRLGGAVFTGFYPQFDFQFLRAEMHRIGHEFPSVRLLCVNELARCLAPDLPGRKLEACCAYFGIPLIEAHSAFEDASATAKILSECLKRTNPQGRTLLQRLGVEPVPAKASMWPNLPVSGKSYTRAVAAKAAKSEVSFIAKLVASLPSVAGTDPRLDRYLALLDRVLEDRLVTADEAGMLFHLALELGISQEQAREAHLRYVRDLMAVALADGVITEREEEDLRDVNRLFSIPEAKFNELLLEVKANAPSGSATGPRSATPTDDLAGLTICFTGEFTCRIKGNAVSRGLAEGLAQQRGMIVRKGVTKDLDLLVAADPNSMSGKAKKARQYGIRIIAEPVFWQRLGIDID